MCENQINIYVELCRDDAVLPAYANPWDAGMDVCAAEESVIKPGQTVVVPTGLKLAIPEGYEIQVRPRSGISLKTPLRLANSPGTIDSGYRDELGIIMTNTSPGCCCNDEEPLTLDRKDGRTGVYCIKKGDRIAQIILQLVPRMAFTVVRSVKDIGTDRAVGSGRPGFVKC
jgi:dUTP pyrophosphatase